MSCTADKTALAGALQAAEEAWSISHEACEKLEAYKNEAEKFLASYRDEVERLRAEKVTLQTRLNMTEEEVERLVVKRFLSPLGTDSLWDEVKRLQAENERWERIARDYETASGEYLAEVEKLKREYARTENDNERLREDRDKWQALAEDNPGWVREDEYDRMKVMLKGKESVLADADREVERLRAENKHLRIEHLAQEGQLLDEIARLQRFIDSDTPGQCRDCPGGKNWEAEIERLQAELFTTQRDLSHEVERLRVAHQDEMLTVTSMGDEVKRLREEAEDVSAAVVFLDEENKRLRAHNQDLYKLQVEARREVERLREALEEIGDERRTDMVWMKQRARNALAKES